MTLTLQPDSGLTQSAGVPASGAAALARDAMVKTSPGRTARIIVFGFPEPIVNAKKATNCWVRRLIG